MTFILPTPLNLIIPVAGLTLVGIPHGSLDHHLYPKNQSTLRFYLKYILGVLLFLGLWAITPFLALFGFIYMSADHFGECQFIDVIKASKNSSQTVWLSWFWGLSASLFSPLIHWNETTPILKALTHSDFFQMLPANVHLVTLFVVGIFGLFAAKKLDIEASKKLDRPTVALPATVMLFAFFAIVPMLPGFLTFFCFWHAWDSVNHQKTAKGWSVKQYIKLGAPTTAIALFGIAGVFLLLHDIGFTERASGALFILLGALSFSHTEVMKDFYFVKK